MDWPLWGVCESDGYSSVRSQAMELWVCVRLRYEMSVFG